MDFIRASHRKVHGFCQPDRPATEHVPRAGAQARGASQGSLYAAEQEKAQIQVQDPRRIRTGRVKSVKNTRGARTKGLYPYVSTAKSSDGYVGEPVPMLAARGSLRDQSISSHGPLAGAGGQGRIRSRHRALIRLFQA